MHQHLRMQVGLTVLAWIMDRAQREREAFAFLLQAISELVPSADEAEEGPDPDYGVSPDASEAPGPANLIQFPRKEPV